MSCVSPLTAARLVRIALSRASASELLATQNLHAEPACGKVNKTATFVPSVFETVNQNKRFTLERDSFKWIPVEAPVTL